MTQIVLKTSSVVGTAPMAVQFDAVDTVDATVGDTFKDLRYDFDFGDPSSGAWATSGKSKNTEAGGPLAVHVYDTPGLYTATVRAGDSIETVVIQVDSPDVKWSGVDTVCLSMSGNFSGAPFGAELVTPSEWPVWESNKRYMLRAGDDFNSLGMLQTDNITDTRFTSYGAGAQPIVSAIQTQRSTKNYPKTGDPFIKNVDVIDLFTSELFHALTGRNVLWYKNTVGAGAGIQIANSMDFHIKNYSNLYTPQQFFVIENTMTSGVNNKANGKGQINWAGNTIEGTDEHNTRFFQFWKTYIGHNDFLGRSYKPGKANIKVHAQGFKTFTDPDALWQDQNITANRWQSRYAVIANNLFNSVGNIWATGTAKPQDRVQGEGLEDIIFESNTHNGGPSNSAGAFAGRNIITRDEVFLGGIGAPKVGHLQESLPVEWQGEYFINAPMPPAPDEVVDPPIDPPIVCDEGYELIDGVCVPIVDPPIEPPTEPCTCVDGAKGDKGDTGEQGIQGVQGIQGIQGLQGTAGTDGTITPEMQEALDFYEYLGAWFSDY